MSQSQKSDSVTETKLEKRALAMAEVARAHYVESWRPGDEKIPFADVVEAYSEEAFISGAEWALAEAAALCDSRADRGAGYRDVMAHNLGISILALREAT